MKNKIVIYFLITAVIIILTIIYGDGLNGDIKFVNQAAIYDHYTLCNSTLGDTLDCNGETLSWNDIWPFTILLAASVNLLIVDTKLVIKYRRKTNKTVSQ